MGKLLPRNKFKEAVFARDKNKCVLCSAPAVDAHHIIEKRLFPDGGYYIGNGSSLCSPCHLKAESTEASCKDIRAACGIEEIILPPHFESNYSYTKWGDILRADGMRIPGELYGDESVRKILGSLASLYVSQIKYPRTFHLPWSPGATRDDRMMKSLDALRNTDVVVTEKLDGENSTIYRNAIHSRSLNYSAHPSRTRMKALHSEVKRDIPEGWRVCGENLTAVHSIKYESLPHFFMVFSIWDEYNWCLSWENTLEYAAMLGLHTVPTLYKGPFNQALLEDLEVEGEGYVVRPAASFHYKTFRNVVGKYVRKNHVQTSTHWLYDEVKYNNFP